MNNLIMLIFTGVIAASTVVYTVMSYRQWKATRLAADISRYTLFLSFLLQIHKEAERARLAQKQPDAAILEQFEIILMEAGLGQLITDADVKKNEKLRTYISQMEVLFRANNIDPDSLPVLRDVFRRIKD